MKNVGNGFEKLVNITDPKFPGDDPPFVAHRLPKMFKIEKRVGGGDEKPEESEKTKEREK